MAPSRLKIVAELIFVSLSPFFPNDILLLETCLETSRLRMQKLTFGWHLRIPPFSQLPSPKSGIVQIAPSPLKSARTIRVSSLVPGN